MNAFQLLALTTTDGNFFLGTLSKTTCWLRNIAVTDGSKRPTPASSRRNPDRAPPPASSATANNESSNIDGSQASPARGWGWRLLGTGRSAVAAAANAAVDALSAPLPTDDETDNSEDPHFVGRGRGGGGTAGERSGAGEGRGDGAAAAAATGAVGVEFSVKGCLMAVALEDGTVLLTRVERYTSGVRCAMFGRGCGCDQRWGSGRGSGSGGGREPSNGRRGLVSLDINMCEKSQDTQNLESRTEGHLMDPRDT